MTDRTMGGALSVKRERSWWIPYSFFAFFGVVLAANGTMLYFAIDSWTGLDTSRPYEQGLAMNDQIAEARAQAERGWQAELVIDQDLPLTAGLSLRLKDRAGAPLDHAGVTAVFRRPTQKALDTPVLLERRDVGLYKAEAALPEPGIWDLRLIVEHEKGHLRLDRRVTVK